MMFLIFMAMHLASCSTKTKNSTLNNFTENANKIFKGYPLTYESEFSSINNSFIIFSVQASFLNEKDYDEKIKNNIEKEDFFSIKDITILIFIVINQKRIRSIFPDQQYIPIK